MADEIRPALTPDEWVSVQRERDDPERFGPVSGTTKPLTAIALSYEDGWFPTGDLTNPFTPHALMALINNALADDDPRKITRDDVARLRSVEEQLEDALNTHAARIVREMADKLAALLPPA